MLIMFDEYLTYFCMQCKYFYMYELMYNYKNFHVISINVNRTISL